MAGTRRAVVLTTALLVATADPALAQIAERFPGAAWTHVDAVQAGWPNEKLAEAEALSRQLGSTAVMVIHHGFVVAEWGDTAAESDIASIRKGLLSALIGNAVKRGEIELATTLEQLGIDDNEPSLSAEEKSATVRDLLEERSGIYHPALFEGPDMAAKRPPRHGHAPGTFWYCNNWDANALGAIYERASRHSIFDAFEQELARPVGMEDYRVSDGRYVTGPASVYPAYPFKMSARDLARFALLYLHNGRWQDRQAVPSDWVEESTRSYSDADLATGYGYLWWIGSPKSSIGPSPTGAEPPSCFFALGLGGQLAFVSPADDLVIVRRGAVDAPAPRLGDLNRFLRILSAAGHVAR